MITVRFGRNRGHFDHGWLDTYHTFSFGEYDDPDNEGYRVLRVINEDRVQPGQGFGMHGHRDMEIVTYIVAGQLEHKDSLGNGSLIRAGELQRMTAGAGVRHSEFNPSDSEAVHLYQIWLLPEAKGLSPGYEQRAFSPQEKAGRWNLVASRDGREQSLTIRQDAEIFLATLKPGERISHAFRSGRYGWLQIIRGDVEVVDALLLSAGDGAAFDGQPTVDVTGRTEAEVLLFDLP